MNTQALLTSQEVALLEYIRQGMPADQAIRMAGMDFDKAASFLATDERGNQAVEFSATLHTTSFNITKDLITSQLYQARARSISAAEDVMCLREIAKIHGLYETKIKVVNENSDGASEGQLALKAMYRKSDDELIAELDTVGVVMDLLPEKIVRDSKKVTVVDGEFVDV